MTWTYGGDPSASPIAEVRFLLQDTIPTRPLLQDEEIQYAITALETTYNSPIMAAAYCADLIAGRFATNVSMSADGVSVQAQDLSKQFGELAVRLRAQYEAQQGAGAVPYAGGTNRFEWPDWGVKPKQFAVGMDDNPDAGYQSATDRGIPWPESEYYG